MAKKSTGDSLGPAQPIKRPTTVKLGVGKGGVTVRGAATALKGDKFKSAIKGMNTGHK